MPDFWAGRSAVSLAGHDKGRIYVVVRTEGPFAFVSDGRLKPLSSPKKKKLKHLRAGKDTALSVRFGNGEPVRDEEIRRVLKELVKSSEEESGGVNVES